MTGLCNNCGLLRKIKHVGGKWLCKRCTKQLTADMVARWHAAYPQIVQLWKDANAH